MDRLAAFVSPGRSLDGALRRARVAEELGYEAVFDNHIANRDGMVVLAAYATATRTVRLGTGVYPALLQTPVSLAQQAATLDEILGGRLVLGLGTSHRPVIEGWHGRAFPDHPVAAMREVLTVVRSLLTTGEARFDGEHGRAAGFRFRDFTPRPDIPIMLAALSPAMLRLAGELSDGVILWLCDPSYVRDVVVPAVSEGARSAGRDPSEVEILAAVSCALTDDTGPVFDGFRRSIAAYLSLPFYRAMLHRSGYDDDLARFDAGLAEGGVDGALAGVSDALVRSLAGIGTSDDVRAKVAEYRAAGVTLPAVGPLTSAGAAPFEETLAAAAGW